ncbi:glycosyltransferase family 2 protein [Bacillus alkalicellulosilyticus]|uniref:glycosyltransferase family 2 protein n=1 Tax=Alkalihalobacterium alkalicellulosilyticum TaxID=1912214 RepID=UPI0009964AF5|nr:glycosyltransferase family 2 protein [Bacillus alkalicellulosilyticus]
MTKVSVIVPAYNEEKTIATTLMTLKNQPWVDEVIVVNDGSTDQTRTLSDFYGDQTIHFEENKGKGAALQAGWKQASGDIIVCVDADLEESVAEAKKLIEPFQYSFIDSVIGRLPLQRTRGFGIVKERAKKIIYQQTGKWITAPLSGQRAFRKKWVSLLTKKSYYGFGVETAMTIDMLKAGATIIEVDTNITHRATGKDVAGFFHRGKQWIELEVATWRNM